MGNIFYQDFRYFIQLLNEFDVKYILVGGYSVIFHGYSRTTGDMDLWVKRDKENYKKIEKAFAKFGLAVFDMTENNFLTHPIYDVYSFGNPPVCIDILVKVKGLEFDECFNESQLFDDDGLKIRTINYNHLIQSKKAANRPKDIDDINNLMNE
jgi:predicted nucleotidyltransferase